MDPGPSSRDLVPGSSPHEAALSPRRREKCPAAGVSLDDVQLDDSRLDQASVSAKHNKIRAPLHAYTAQEIALLFSQYLHSRSQGHVARVIDEQLLGRTRSEARLEEIEAVERALLDGDFASVEGLIGLPGLLRPQTQKAFLYMCYRQQFLEHVENRESQKAFNLLQKRIKPLEHYQPVPYDFYNLAYLTSASTVHDAPGFRDWAGAAPERERLVGMWRELTEGDGLTDVEKVEVPPNRLVTLLRQAASWQVQVAKRRGRRPWTVSSLLEDYHISALPTRLSRLVVGHTANIKCVAFLHPDGELAVSGSSDATLRVFSTSTGELQTALRGHTSRVWDCAASLSGRFVASASGDGTVRLWDAGDGVCKSVMSGDGGDVYSVRWRPGREDQVVSASYDKILRSWDVEVGRQLRTFSGHGQSTLAVAFDPTGHVIASGSKDKHIRLWDAVGGVCVQTMAACLGEITSVEFDHEGKYLLAGCKDNSNRLWDLRMQRNLYRYTGHQNTSKNLIRCGFALDSSIVVGGSEDGMVYLWEREGAGTTDTAHRPPSILQPNGSDPSGSGSGSGFGIGSGPGLAPAVMAGGGASRSSPAYYPPREVRSTPASVGSGANVRPLRVLEAHGSGAVFDVRWCAGGMVSAGEDGAVGVWDVDEEESDEAGGGA